MTILIDVYCRSPSRCNRQKTDKNANGTQHVKKLIDPSDENGCDSENQIQDNNVLSNIEGSDVIDFSLQFNVDYSSTSDENADQDSEIDYEQANGGPDLHYDCTSEKSPNGYINGISKDTTLYTNNANDFSMVKSDVVSPTKEAQYANIVAVQTNPKCASVVCQTAKHPFLKTFAPVYEENVVNVAAHMEYPVYATIGTPTVGTSVIKVLNFYPFSLLLLFACP